MEPKLEPAMELPPGTPAPQKKNLRNSLIVVGSLCLAAGFKSIWGSIDDHASKSNQGSVAYGTADNPPQVGVVNQPGTNPPSNTSSKTPPPSKALEIKPLTSADLSKVQAWAVNGMRLMSEASRSLQKELSEAGWSDSISAFGIDIPGEIERRIACEDNAIRIFNNYKQHELKLLNDWRDSIPALNLSLGDQQSVIAWSNRLYNPESLSRNFDSKSKISEISKERLQLLLKTKGHWRIKNNMIIFMRNSDQKADLEFYKAQEGISNTILKDKTEFETIIKEDVNKLGIIFIKPK
jgi:hypothetical protein